MDPITAFSIACGIIQILDFSTKVVSKCREIYKDGSTSEHAQLRAMAEHLTSLQSEGTRITQTTSCGQTGFSASDKELMILAQQCSTIAGTLVDELQSLEANVSHSYRQALKLMMKAMKKKSKIERLQKERAIRNSIQQAENFNKLDNNIRALVSGLTRGQTTIDELKQFLKQSDEATKQHITHEFRQLELSLSEKEYRQKFLESLWFPEINAREERIKDAHKNTYEWIFRTADSAAPCWSNFDQWLRNGSDIYCISGKAGSGKSTLMRYICDHDRTRSSLEEWSIPRECIIVTHFFWKPGSVLQKTFEGLYRSLLHHILSQCPHIIPTLKPKNSRLNSDHEPIAAWTDARLKNTLCKAIEEVSKTQSLWFLIDGLDELSHDHEDLVAFIKDVLISERAKACVSSRPLRSFYNTLSSSPMLRLQDLTRNDITAYVLDSLHREDDSEIAPIATNIVDRAEGVFLWATLVVKEVNTGLKNEDSLETLGKRINSLPAEVEDLYAHMLAQIDHLYKGEAARCFHLALYGFDVDNFDLLAISLAVHEEQDNSPLSFSKFSVKESIGLCQRVKRRLPTICAGLLEVSEDSWSRQTFTENYEMGVSWEFADPHAELKEPSQELWELTDLLCTTRVDWIHRTAADFFFRHGGRGGHFLDANTPSSFSVTTVELKTAIAACRLIGAIDKTTLEGDWTDHLPRIMSIASRSEESSDVAQTALCDYVCQSLQTIEQQARTRSTARPELHLPWKGDAYKHRQMQDSDEELELSEDDENQPRREYYGPRAKVHSELLSIFPAWEAENTSEPRDHSTFWSNAEFEFLCYAASNGVLLYVKARLDADSNLANEGIAATQLLACYCMGLKSVIDENFFGTPLPSDFNRIEALSELLRRGADPNAGLVEGGAPVRWSTTIWGLFLQSMIYSSRYRTVLKARDGTVEIYWNSDDVKAWSKPVKDFLDYGADIQHICSLRIRRFHSFNAMESLPANIFKEFERAGLTE
ncbi:MAG: hypothetical protein Q9191_001916, partial [Dirinaria sp. TL-2023a]